MSSDLDLRGPRRHSTDLRVGDFAYFAGWKIVVVVVEDWGSDWICDSVTTRWDVQKKVEKAVLKRVVQSMWGWVVLEDGSVAELKVPR